ncbi:hypothetical protein OA57_04350 [Chelonobacter oris]|uniref:Uncharacterized protein n=1 Tax=Chelonobacter oris TaxID=505317 RepID=A0A0A3AU92_9PAST|nr:hypothetical protein [Chelonobacter oris]KGQ70620.1 hypothetical protein OA57_04350 [Chelonobacter oris]
MLIFLFLSAAGEEQRILLLTALFFLIVGAFGYYQKQNEFMIGMLLAIGLTLGSFYQYSLQYQGGNLFAIRSPHVAVADF